MSRSRLLWDLTYSPGFTFYQKISERNEIDQSFTTSLRYRMSPHVTLSLHDTFRQTSNVLNQPPLETLVSGAVQDPNFSLVTPVAETLTNYSGAELTYQFGPNQMVGISGTFSYLHFPNPSEAVGLSDTTSRGGSAYYTHRISKLHYVGVTYQYSYFLAYPTGGQSVTQTHSALFFYTLYLSRSLTLSAFGGPQYSDTMQFGIPSYTAWTPAAGGSLNWQGLHTGLALEYSHRITDGGGLYGSVKSNSGSGSIHQQITKSLSAILSAAYAQNDILQAIPTLNQGGHTLSGGASLNQRLGERLSVGLSYTHVHQTYTGIEAFSVPDRNREAVTISYSFSRPLGR
jgi:hypothetical protein